MSSNDPYQHQNQEHPLTMKDVTPAPKVLGFMPIYYAGSYLKEALLSVRDHVDKMVVAYTRKPSQGFNVDVVCPDTEESILFTCQEVLGEKLIWEPAMSYPSESHHREVRYKHAENYDLILSVDTDEVMLGLEEALNYAATSTSRYYGIDGYVNFFRSHEWCCLDGFRPIRIENLHANNTGQDLNCKMRILHFSLCQSEAIMRLKYKTFGHASEIRPNYLEEIFYKWSPTNNIPDLHPVALGLWNAIPYDKDAMPDYLKEHVNHNKEIIR